jgi:hypothetical protein
MIVQIKWPLTDVSEGILRFTLGQATTCLRVGPPVRPLARSLLSIALAGSPVRAPKAHCDIAIRAWRLRSARESEREVAAVTGASREGAGDQGKSIATRRQVSSGQCCSNHAHGTWSMTRLDRREESSMTETGTRDELQGPRSLRRALALLTHCRPSAFTHNSSPCLRPTQSAGRRPGRARRRPDVIGHGSHQ